MVCFGWEGWKGLEMERRRWAPNLMTGPEIYVLVETIRSRARPLPFHRCLAPSPPRRRPNMCIISRKEHSSKVPPTPALWGKNFSRSAGTMSNHHPVTYPVRLGTVKTVGFCLHPEISSWPVKICMYGTLGAMMVERIITGWNKSKKVRLQDQSK